MGHSIEGMKEENKKSFGEIWSTLTTEQSKYLRDYINRQRERSYSEEEVYKLLLKYQNSYIYASNETGLKYWFEQFKKK